MHIIRSTSRDDKPHTLFCTVTQTWSREIEIKKLQSLLHVKMFGILSSVRYLIISSVSYHQFKHNIFAFCIDALSLDLQPDDGH
jgi:hypothetical protein